MFLVATVLDGIGQYFLVSFTVYRANIIYDADKAPFATQLFEATALGVVVGSALPAPVRKSPGPLRPVARNVE